MMQKGLLLAMTGLVWLCNTLSGQPLANPFVWSQDTLCVHLPQAKVYMRWQGGQLSWLGSAAAGQSGIEWAPGTGMPDVMYKGMAPADSSWYSLELEPATARKAAAHVLHLYARHMAHLHRRTIRVLQGSTGLWIGHAFKGSRLPEFQWKDAPQDMIESEDLFAASIPHYLNIPLPATHLEAEVLRFREATDYHNYPVSSDVVAMHSKSLGLQGNMLLLRHPASGLTHLVVKLSPLQKAQANYAGIDFSMQRGSLAVHSPGIDAALVQDDWQEAYPLVLFLYQAGRAQALVQYKQYELAEHQYLPQYDNTFVMNTWGDRNRDSRINEDFIVKELEAAAQLGIAQYQIDDGWQQGTSKNSARQQNQKWDSWTTEDWAAHTERFPRGLGPVVQAAAQKNIGLGLWFNPSKNEQYALWQRDADLLIDLHKQWNVNWVKLDGLQLGTKLAEQRLQAMLHKVQQATDHRVQFNMDVTAGQRGGYFFLHRYGNLFLENRYTDWGNYYPHLTLRNVWHLSHYMPIQRVQIEFLNKWRNPHKYTKNDPLSPANVPFDYQFAISMVGQPLAWMEATGLPKESFALQTLVRQWQPIRNAWSQGIIHPIGTQPNGFGCPGFVSLGQRSALVLLFNESQANPRVSFSLQGLPIPAGKPGFTSLAGSAKWLGYNPAAQSMEVKFSGPHQFLLGELKW